jgi:hypothetical protein
VALVSTLPLALASTVDRKHSKLSEEEGGQRSTYDDFSQRPIARTGHVVGVNLQDHRRLHLFRLLLLLLLAALLESSSEGK